METATAGLFMWQRNLVHAFATHDVVVLYGNISDRYIYRDGPYHYECTLRELLVRLLYDRYGSLFVFDRFEKATQAKLGEGRALTIERDPTFGEPGFDDTL